MCGMTRDLTTVIFPCRVRHHGDQEFRIFLITVIFSFIFRSEASEALDENQVPNDLKGLDVHSMPMFLSW